MCVLKCAKPLCSAEGVISLGSGTVHTLLGQVQAAQEKFGPAEAQFQVLRALSISAWEPVNLCAFLQAAVNIFSEVCGFVHPHTAQSLGQLSAIQAELVCVCACLRVCMCVSVFHVAPPLLLPMVSMIVV